MPRNLRGGKHKHAKRGSRQEKDETLTLAGDQPGCMYAMIQKKLGTAFEVLCSNGKTERALIRGKFRCKVWMNIGDIVLVDGSELGKFYIIHKYTPDQARQLKSKGEISFDVKGSSDQDGVLFEGEENNSSDEDDELFKEFNIAKDKIQIVDEKSELKQEPKQQTKQDPKKEEADVDSEQENSEDDVSSKDEENGLSEDKEDEEDEEDEKEDGKPRRKEESLINKDKLLKQFKNKAHGGRGIIRERGRAAARDKKNRTQQFA